MQLTFHHHPTPAPTPNQVQLVTEATRRGCLHPPPALREVWDGGGWGARVGRTAAGCCELQLFLPLERLTMFSKNVFCGATSPRLPPGILGLESGGQDPRRGRGGCRKRR